MTTAVEQALSTLRQVASQHTGHDERSLAEGPLRALLEARSGSGDDPRAVAARAREGDPEILEAIAQALNAETFFERHPEHFELAAQWVAERPWPDLRPLRAWSAGCATGEEAYTLAATLLERAPKAGGVEVLGTDLDRVRLERAQRGRYLPRSAREPSMPWWLVPDSTRSEIAVHPRLKEVTFFAPHNLLRPPPGTFDLIFCRNVLIYFSAPSALKVREQLASALAPGGLLLLGTVDERVPPEGLEKVGPATIQAFTRPPPPFETPAASPLPEAPPRPATPPAPRLDARAVERHLGVVALIEGGDLFAARQALEGLCQSHPAYLPGLLELALLHARLGQPVAARAAMRRLELLAAGLPPEATVEGLQGLTADYYLRTARTYLDRGGTG